MSLGSAILRIERYCRGSSYCSASKLEKGYFARSIMEILEYSSSVKYLQELSRRCNNLPLRQLIQSLPLSLSRSTLLFVSCYSVMIALRKLNRFLSIIHLRNASFQITKFSNSCTSDFSRFLSCGIHKFLTFVFVYGFLKIPRILLLVFFNHNFPNNLHLQCKYVIRK